MTGVIFEVRARSRIWARENENNGRPCILARFSANLENKNVKNSMSCRVLTNKREQNECETS